MRPAPATGIAVLPFENLSENKADAYFAEAIQDEILTRLSKIFDLKVIARTSTLHYKSKPGNLPAIGKQLGVAYILEGSVEKSADAVRVNVQLIKAATSSHVWADTFDHKFTDIFSVQSEVARAIVDQLRPKLTSHEEQVIAATPTENPEAYDAYLRGLAYSVRTQRTPANSLGAQKYLRQAVHLDPKFALAWALLAYTDAVGYHTANLQPTIALCEETRQAAETALTLQPALGEAVLARGYYHYACLKDYDSAVRYLEQARSLLPNNSRILQSLADVERTRATGTGATPTSTKLSGSTRATSYYLTNTPFPLSLYVAFPKHCENLIRSSILRKTTLTPPRSRPPSRKPRAICLGLLRFWLHCIRTPTTSAPGKYRLTRRSWSATLHRSSLG